MESNFFVQVQAIQVKEDNREELIRFLSKCDTVQNWCSLERAYPGEWLVLVPGSEQILVLEDGIVKSGDIKGN